MAKSTYLSNKLLDHRYGATSFTAPATVYLALLIAPNWAASTAISLNAYVWSGSRIFKCTTAGTTGGSAPSWTSTAGGTTSDGSVVWTEQSTALLAGIPTGLECSGSGYSRLAITNNTTNFPAASASSKSNGTTLTFSQATGTWGQVVGGYLMDASSSGNALDYGFVTTPKDFVNLDTASFAVGAFTFSES